MMDNSSRLINYYGNYMNERNYEAPYTDYPYYPQQSNLMKRKPKKPERPNCSLQ